MSRQEAPIHRLQDYLPDGTYETVLNYLRQYKVHLTVTRARKSILGDYRHRTHIKNHRISVNGDLNKYAFLITLLHELAHLLTFEQYGTKVPAHGREWKTIYSGLLDQFLKHKIFQEEIEKELMRSLKNPAASSCAEDGLLRVLRKFDLHGKDNCFVEDLSSGVLFQTEDGRIFRLEEKLRKRFKCTEVRTGKIFLFSPVHKVQPV